MCREPHPHLLYPQFRQVAHPSIMITALVLHLWHIVAPGGKAREGFASLSLRASPETGEEERVASVFLRADSPSVPARSFVSWLPGFTSDFFFESLATRA